MLNIKAEKYSAVALERECACEAMYPTRMLFVVADGWPTFEYKAT